MNPDKMSEQELRREVKELREGKCRLNCRSVKEAFYAGFDYAKNPEDHGNYYYWQGVDTAYEDWKEQT